MRTRVSPEENPLFLLLKPQPIAHKISPIQPAVHVSELIPKKIPANLKTGSKPVMEPTPEDVVAPSPAEVETLNPAAQTAIGYRVDGGKMKSVIPKRRRLVKTMIYHSIKEFIKSLFLPSAARRSSTTL